MKRKKPLTRKTPLRNKPRVTGQENKETRPEKPSWRQKRANGIRAVSDKAKRVQKLDDLARKICKKIGQCEAREVLGGECDGPLEWAHMIRRDQLASRWRQDNCMCLCQAHHRAVTQNAKLWWLLFSEDHYYEIKKLTMGMPTDQFIEKELVRLKAM